jgi:hypothetical protein
LDGLRDAKKYIYALLLIAYLSAASLAAASGYQGPVPFSGIAVPGATVTATQDDDDLTVVFSTR